MNMRVAIASDHAGFLLKGKVAEYLGSLGHTVEDLGTRDTTRSTIRILRKPLPRRFSASALSAPY